MIKRFNPDFSLSISHELAYMRETPEGGYVAHGDYATLFSELESVKADRDAQQKRADALAVENGALFASVGEVYAAGYNHGHLNTVDGIAYTEGVEGTFFERGAQVLAESADLTASNNTYVQLEVMTAENVSMKSAITTHSQSTHFCELCGKDDPCSTDDVCYVLNETPATSAALAAIEARGVEKSVERITILMNHQAPAVAHVINALNILSVELREAK